MTDLRKSFFWVAFYLLIILMLGLLDRADIPIINFVSFFYILGIFSVTVMIFVPSLHKVPVMAPMVFWGAIYFALLRVIDRSETGSTDLEVVLLELVVLELGVWLSYQLAVAIDRSESLMDILAQGTFPHSAVEMDKASELIKVEFSRSRRYHRPLSLLVVHAISTTWKLALNCYLNKPTCRSWVIKPISVPQKPLNYGRRIGFSSKLFLVAISKKNCHVLCSVFSTLCAR